MDRRRWLTIGVVAALAVVAFLLFRPDTLFTDVEADESLEEAFATTTEAEVATTTTATPTTIADTTLATTHDHRAGRAGAAASGSSSGSITRHRDGLRL